MISIHYSAKISKALLLVFITYGSAVETIYLFIYLFSLLSQYVRGPFCLRWDELVTVAFAMILPPLW